MNKLLHSTWLVALLGCASYLGTTLVVWRLPREVVAGRSRPAGLGPAAGGPSWRFHNPEVDSLIQELKGQRQEMQAQKTRLEEWAARLQAERVELNVVTQQVYQMQSELDQTLIRIKSEEQENLKRLAKTYAAMTTEGAVSILQELADEPLAKILTQMKESEAAPILEALAKEPGQAKRAALISERLRLTLWRNTAATRTAAK